MCPAVILAKRRKHNVIGRTIILIISTTLRNGTRYQGELAGSKEPDQSFFIKRKIKLENHSIQAAQILNAKVVVTGKLKIISEIKFNNANAEKIGKK